MHFEKQRLMAQPLTFFFYLIIVCAEPVQVAAGNLSCKILFKNPLEFFLQECYYNYTRESTHSKVDAPSLSRFLSLRTPPILWFRQDRHFYFRLFLFLLSRKASNAVIKQPKDISKANIPIKIEMIS